MTFYELFTRIKAWALGLFATKEDVNERQNIYSVNTSQISNPKEGDISTVSDSLVVENMQTGSGGSLNNGTYLRISDLSGLDREVLRNGGKIEITGSFLGFISGTVCSIEVRLISHTPTLIVTDFRGEENQINWQQGFDVPAQILSGNTPYTVGYITITETVESGQHSILQYVKIDSLLPGSVQEYKNGAWIDRKNFPTTFDSLPTDGSENLIKSSGVSAGIKSMAQSYCGVSTEPSSPKEGDVWDSPLVESIPDIGWSGQIPFYMPNNNYQTKITLADGATTVNISVRKSDQTTETLTDPMEFPKIYPAGEVYFVSGDGTGLGTVYNYQPAFKKVYHDGSWVDVDTMFPSIDNTPTANSNNLVKSGGVYSEVHPAVVSTQPQGGMLPNVEYDLGTLTGNVTFALANAVSGITNHYYWTFDTGSTAPTITWPSGITWYGGSAPTINADKHYEISVLNGIGVAMEV